MHVTLIPHELSSIGCRATLYGATCFGFTRAPGRLTYPRQPWYGASVGATRGLIQLNGDSYRVSKRLWALAGYSRFIRPNATRIGATTGDGNLRLSAFRNADGSLAVVALNTARSANSISYTLPNTGISAGTATPYLTNNSNSTAAQPAIRVNGGAFTATVPARSLVTYRITGNVATTITVAADGSGNYTNIKPDTYRGQVPISSSKSG